jgi:hypothetical protein
MVDLIESVDRYDPGTEASFSTFACYRIKGARGAVLNRLQRATERRQQLLFRRRQRRERFASIAAGVGEAESDPFSEMAGVTVEPALSFMLDTHGFKAFDDIARPALPVQSDGRMMVGDRPCRRRLRCSQRLVWYRSACSWPARYRAAG